MDKIEDKGKTKVQLIEELQALRRQLAELQEREQAGESPLGERDMLHILMENVPDWIFFKDAESRIVRSNRAHVQLLGFDVPEEVIGKTDFDLFPSKIAQRAYDEEQKMLQSGQSVVARLGQTPGKDGEVFWVSETKIPLKDETGRVIGLVGISRDVTEIKRAEETLKEAHAEIEKQVEERTAELEREVAERTRAEASLAHESDLLQALLDNSPDYIFFKDRESRFVKTNKTHAQVLMGLDSPQEAVGKTDFDLFLREEAQRFYDEEQKIMDTGQPMVAREWSLTSSTTNELVWLSEHKLPIRDETGRVIGLVGISRDITKLKRVEEALKEARAELEQQVRELSTPVIPIMDRILVMPLVGSIDSIRARDITRALLAGISRHQAKVVILDMTGVALVNTQVVNHLNKTMQAAQLKGAQTIVTGMTEAVAETIVDLGIDWSGVQTLADLQTGLRVALSSLDLQLIKYQG